MLIYKCDVKLLFMQDVKEIHVSMEYFQTAYFNKLNKEK